MELHEKLRKLRKLNKWSQLQVAILCGWATGDHPSQRISNYERSPKPGKEKNKRQPSLESLQKLAEVFRTTVEWLVFDRGNPPDYWPDQPHNIDGKIPHYNSSDLIELLVNKSEIKTDKYIKPPLDNSDKNLFAYTVDDYSMGSGSHSPKSYTVGELLIVDREKQPKDGDLVVVINKAQVLFRKLINDGTKMFLSAANSMYPPLEFNPDNAVFCGVVISSIYNNDSK